MPWIYHGYTMDCHDIAMFARIHIIYNSYTHYYTWFHFQVQVCKQKPHDLIMICTPFANTMQIHTLHWAYGYKIDNTKCILSDTKCIANSMQIVDTLVQKVDTLVQKVDIKLTPLS